MSNKVKAKDPHIVVSGNIDKPYYSIRYYDVSDNTWHIGFSSYNLKFVVEWLKTEFETVESDIEPVRHGKWKQDCLECSVCKRNISEICDADSYLTSGIELELIYCPFCGAKMDLGDDL